MLSSNSPVKSTKNATGASWLCGGRSLTRLTGKSPARLVHWVSSAEFKNLIKVEDWNEIHIIARGNTLIQLINGRVMSALIDDDKAGRKMEGEIGIQLHKTANAMKIEARNIRLKTF